MTAVAHGMQDAEAGIVEDKGDRTEEIGSEIGDGVGQYLGRRAHHSEHRGRKQHAEHGHEQAGKYAQRKQGVDGSAQVLYIARAKIARNDDAGAA